MNGAEKGLYISNETLSLEKLRGPCPGFRTSDGEENQRTLARMIESLL